MPSTGPATGQKLTELSTMKAAGFITKAEYDTVLRRRHQAIVERKIGASDHNFCLDYLGPWLLLVLYSQPVTDRFLDVLQRLFDRGSLGVAPP